MTVEQVREMGWEEAFVRWVEAYPERLNVNAATGLVAAVLGVTWQKVDERDKELARRVVARLRRERAQGR